MLISSLRIDHSLFLKEIWPYRCLTTLISDQLHCEGNNTRAVGVELCEQPKIMSYHERKQNCYYKIFKNTW